MRKILTFTLFLFIIIAPMLPSSFTSDYYFKSYKVEDGLSQNSVFCIHQDSRGFMWFGTNDGLNRFDGYNFKVYRKTSSAQSIGNSKIVCIAEDKNGLLYVGTAIGVYLYNPTTESFTFFDKKTQSNINIGSRVNALEIDRNNKLWIGTNEQGAFVYDITKGKLNRIDHDSTNKKPLSPTSISNIMIDSRQNIWFVSDDLYQYNPVTRQFKKYYPKSIGREKLAMTKLYEDSFGNIWVGSKNNGLQKLNKETENFTLYFGKNSPDYIPHIHDIMEISPGILAIGSNSGLVQFDIRTEKHSITEASQIKGGLSDNSIYCFYMDKEGALWLGSYFGGINYLNDINSGIELYAPGNSRNTIKGHAISRFYEDENKNIWIATEDAGLNYFDVSTKCFSQYFGNINIQSILINDDTIWLGTYAQGILVVDKKSKRPIRYIIPASESDDFSGLLIKAIYKDSNNDIWIGCNTGLFKYNPQNGTFATIKGTEKVFVWDIQEDKNKNIWLVSSGYGVFCYNPRNGKLKNYRHSEDDKHTISDNFVLTLCKDNNQDLWFGTEENGFCKYQYTDDNFIRYNNLPKFHNRLIYAIISDKSNHIWFSTSNGLYCFNPINYDLDVYTVDEGLQSNQFNFNSGFKASNGKLYFGGVDGFNAFFPEDLKKNEYIPPVHFTNFQLFNKDVIIGDENSPLEKSLDYTKKITLNYKQNIINFEFVALSYANSHKNQYAYMMEGFDNKWHYTDEHKITYTSLPSGKYVFKVRGSNNDGIWNEDGCSVEIEIKPPFWLSTLAFIVYTIAILGIIYWINRRYIYRERRKQKYALEKAETEKEIELYNSKMNFFTNIAHEVKTPLSLIKAPLEKILNDNNIKDKDLSEDLSVIRRNTEQLNTLIAQLLDFRKAESGTLNMRFTLSNISELVENVFTNFQYTAKIKNISLTFNKPPSDLYADIDSDAFNKIMANLLSNAIKFTKDKIDIDLILPENESDFFTIYVTDNGIGIPDSEKEKIFTPFHQIDNNSKEKNAGGVGIGLSYSRSLAELHHGELSTEDNKDNQGAIFKLTLPCRQISGYKTNDEDPLTNISDNKHISPEISDNTEQDITLLIIEDNDDMRNFLARSLNRKYNILLAVNGKEGLEILEKQIPDMIITDIMMPVMDGIEFTKLVKSKIKWSHIPIIMLTAKNTDDAKIKGFSTGADAYIEKPFSLALLETRIYNLFENREKVKINYTRSPYTQSISIASNKMDEDFIAKMKNIIVANIQNESFSVDELARQMNMSRSGLFAKIKAVSGMSPLDYIKVERLKRSAELLIEGKYALADIALMVGYSTPSYFSKAFKKQFGVYPKDFKKE